jgi:hypothetical protein
MEYRKIKKQEIISPCDLDLYHTSLKQEPGEPRKKN